MEIVYASNFNNKFKENEINNFYGDLLDLEKMGIPLEGIIYDENKSVKRFLGHKRRIQGIFSYLEIDESLLNKKLKDLSKTDFKWILLSYLLINNKKYIIFDYFDIGITYKEHKKLINIVRKLNKDGYRIIVISKNLVFMNQLNSNLNIYIDEDNIINDNIVNLLVENPDLFEVPDIIKFINLANKKGATLDYTLDSKELIKDIYRGVK